MYWIGIDNGVTGAIGIIHDAEVKLFPMPVISEQSYTKSKQMITRIDVNSLRCLLRENVHIPDCRCMIERPMVNPMRWKASASALRALEATIIVLEELQIPYQYLDSKEWQSRMLPQNLGKVVKTKTGVLKRKIDPAELKEASCDIACRLFPTLRGQLLRSDKNGKIKKRDADSVLIARYFATYYGM